MSIKNHFLLVLAFCTVSALSAQVNLLDDSFTSGPAGTTLFKSSSALNLGIGQENLPTSVTWIGNGVPSLPATGESYTNNGNGSGNISFPSLPTTSENVTAFYQPSDSYAVISGAGNSLTLQFDFTVSGTFTSNSAIRFGLFNSGSTGSLDNQITRETGGGVTAGNVGSPALFSGYYASFAPAATTSTAGVVAFYNRAPSNSNSTFISSTSAGTFNQLGYGTTPTTSPGLTTDPYQATLTLQNTVPGSQMTLTFGITDLNTGGTSYSSSVIDTGAAGSNTGVPAVGTTPAIPTQSYANPIVDAFDGLSIGTVSNQGILTVTNVTVSYVPEPPVYVLCSGGLVVFAAASWWIRRRRAAKAVAA
jgi:hypothetical protein